MGLISSCSGSSPAEGTGESNVVRNLLRAEGIHASREKHETGRMLQRRASLLPKIFAFFYPELQFRSPRNPL